MNNNVITFLMSLSLIMVIHPYTITIHNYRKKMCHVTIGYSVCKKDEVDIPANDSRSVDTKLCCPITFSIRIPLDNGQILTRDFKARILDINCGDWNIEIGNEGLQLRDTYFKL